MKQPEPRPTKEQVRAWLQETLKSGVFPTPDSIRTDLNWHSTEPVRRMALS